MAPPVRRSQGRVSPSYPRGGARAVRRGAGPSATGRRPLYAPRLQSPEKGRESGGKGREEAKAQGLTAAGKGIGHRSAGGGDDEKGLPCNRRQRTTAGPLRGGCSPSQLGRSHV